MYPFLINFHIVPLKRVLESNFYHEESCGKAHGFCVLENECPHPVDKEYKSLCPLQKSAGAVCCKECKSKL